MRCDACGKAVAAGDRFCTACGAPLPLEADAPTSPTRPDPATEQLETQPVPAPTTVATTTDDADWGDSDPVWAATGPSPVITAAHPSTSELPATEPIATEPRSGAGTTAVITTPATMSTSELPRVPAPIRERRRFRLTAVTLLSLVGSIVMMLAMFSTVVTVSSDSRLPVGDDVPLNFRTGSWIPSDLADNLPIAGLIAVALLMAGGVAAGFGWRGGSGLAAGCGLAIAGLAALTIGLAQYPIDAAYEMARIPSEDTFTLTITRDVGYWLQIVAGALGVVVFFASLDDAFGDRRPGLNPWVAALGALSGVVMALGPLIPEGAAVWSDNWYVTDGPGEPPAMLLGMRLVQLALLGLASLIGFLCVRRWGLGLAVGGALPAIWLTISTLFDLTEHPVGPGFRNPGTTGMSVHGVTIIGASALSAFLLLAVVAAYDQSQHEW
jgi:hypothetical protein